MMEIKNSKNIDFLCIGHCCHDITQNGYILGGTSSYAALAAKKLGKTPAILSSVGEDFEFLQKFTDAGITFQNVPARRTTVFENIYTKKGRVQYIHNRANTITHLDLPNEYVEVPMVLLGSIAKEIDFGIVDRFDNALLGVTIQGTMRKWDADGLVRSDVMDWDLLNGVDIVFLSDDDVRGYEEYLPEIIKRANQVVMTKGVSGVIVFIEGSEFSFPSFPAEVVDATGAGDVFTTAYMIHFNETQDVEASCIFAHCAASFVIEGIGISNLPTLDQVQKRVVEYKRMIT